MKTEMDIQHSAWKNGDAADDYFKRNQKTLDADLGSSNSTKIFASHIRKNHKVIEIGCSNGRFLEQIRRITNCDAYGIDPSPVAIHDGKAKYPDLRLNRGTADSLQYDDNYFDAVIFGFCLYLVDRGLLMRVVAEADRVLRGGGWLMVTDFDPEIPHRRAFKHHEGIWTYKMQYADLWLANPAYVLVEKISFSHESEGFHPDPNERVASWVLYKQANSGYLEFP
jgi:ubiquinone/menaquinone biosynthesis C-methylase UbiE